MTVNELHYKIKLNLDKIDSFQYPEFTKKEIDAFINRSFKKLIRHLKFGDPVKNNTPMSNEENYQFLSYFIKEVPGVLSGNLVTMPSDCYVLESIYGFITRTSDPYEGKTYEIKFDPAPAKMADDFLRSNFINTPYSRSGYYKILGLNIKLFTDPNTIVNSITVNYIRDHKIVDSISGGGEEVDSPNDSFIEKLITYIVLEIKGDVESPAVQFENEEFKLQQ